MKLNLFGQGKFDEYSFKDMEYGITVLRKEIEEIDVAIKVVRRMTLESFKNKHVRPGGREESHLKVKLSPLEKRKTNILKTISVGEEEILDRLLTGNDDGTVERELLGAVDV